jgi:Cu/Ag efflux protein CusF
MKPVTAIILAAAVMLPAITAAQIKTLPGDSITATATVTAIDHTTRMMTLKAADGTLTTVTVPADVRRFGEIKAGDLITAKYNETIILRMMKPGEAAVNSASGGLAANPGKSPSATATVQRSVTATVTAIDPAAPSVTLVGPETSHTFKVVDREALKQLKVGDRIDVTWAAAVLLSADSPKPK